MLKYTWREELVRFVEGDGHTLREVGYVLLRHVKDAAGLQTERSNG